VLDAEVHLLVHALAPSGTFSREVLAEHCATGLWREGTFEAALRAGVECGVLRGLPAGFIELSPRSRSSPHRVGAGAAAPDPMA
jgi:hypothetical protein